MNRTSKPITIWIYYQGIVFYESGGLTKSVGKPDGLKLY